MRSSFLILDGSSAMLDFVGTLAYHDEDLVFASSKDHAVMILKEVITGLYPLIMAKRALSLSTK